MMIDSIGSKTLSELLRSAVQTGAIRGWSVNGPNVVLYRCDEHYSAIPLVASAILRDLLVQRSTQRIHFRVTAR